jgi:23S rRNA pseudouridine1911/1915/1917 synthase
MTDEPLAFVATDADAGRLDVAIARRFPGAGRRRLATLFDRGGVRVDGKRARKGDRLAAGAHVELTEAPARGEDLRAKPDAAAAARLVILWRGADALAITKPAGMPSQPLWPDELGTAANGIVHLEPACATASDDPRDGGLVHRLDVGTSGVLVAATTPDAWRRIRAAFSAGRATKRYLAVTTARPARMQTQAALAHRGKRVAVDEAEGLPAETAFRLVASSPAGTHHLIECTARSGRMHQVRAHLAHVGAPILGDTLYGGTADEAAPGFFLHAHSIHIPDELEVTSPLPPERVAVLTALGLPVS